MNRRSALAAVAALSLLAIPCAAAEKPVCAGRADWSTCATPWRDDLRVMVAEMEKTHCDLYHAVPHHEFARMVAKLDEEIPKLTRSQIFVGMMKIAAAVGDSRTFIEPPDGFHSLPVALYLFEDGFYVRAARYDLRAIIGLRVARIGKCTVDEAYERVRPVIARDNEQGVRFWAPIFLTIPEVLEATGIVDHAESVELTLEDGEVVTLHPAGLVLNRLKSIDESLWYESSRDQILRKGWLDARGTSDPLWLRHPGEEAYMEMLPGSKTLYVQINRFFRLNRPLEALRARLAVGDVDMLIIDLRLNRGEYGGGKASIVRTVIQSTAIDRKGRFFCIIGRATACAAQALIDDFANYTNVTFVGEPSGSKGNHYGDRSEVSSDEPKGFRLPNSGLTVHTAAYYWQRWAPWRKDEATIPGYTRPLTFDQYRHNVDPALELVRSIAGR